MFQLAIQIYKLIRAIGEGYRNDDSFRAVFKLMIILLIIGSLFYWKFEGWTIVDSIYFSVMTMSTIGYGDLIPTSPVSKLFTVVYALLSIGVFVTVVSKLVEAILRRREHIKEKYKHVKS